MITCFCMRITKLGHCCLLIEEGVLKILTDPGNYSTGQNTARGLKVILITHEHADHLHIESLKKVLDNNPLAEVFTNVAVGKILDKAGIRSNLLRHQGKKVIEGILIEGFGEKHAEVHPDWPRVLNTGFFIGERFFYPGDALYLPERPVEILALPVAGPWLKLSEAVEYAKTVRPKTCFPVHDGMYKTKLVSLVHRLPEKLLSSVGIRFAPLLPGGSITV